MKTRLILIIFALLAQCQLAFADKPSGPGTIKDVPITPIKPIKPRTPVEENAIMAYLDGQLLTITFTEPEGMAGVSLREGGIITVYTGFHATAAPIVVTVRATDLPVQIYIKTQSNEYEGWIE